MTSLQLQSAIFELQGRETQVGYESRNESGTFQVKISLQILLVEVNI